MPVGSGRRVERISQCLKWQRRRLLHLQQNSNKVSHILVDCDNKMNDGSTVSRPLKSAMKKPKPTLPGSMEPSNAESGNDPVESKKRITATREVPYEGISSDEEGEDPDGMLPIVQDTPRRSGRVRRAPKLADGRCVSPMRSKGNKRPADVDIGLKHFKKHRSH